MSKLQSRLGAKEHQDSDATHASDQRGIEGKEAQISLKLISTHLRNSSKSGPFVLKHAGWLMRSGRSLSKLIPAQVPAFLEGLAVNRLSDPSKDSLLLEQPPSLPQNGIKNWTESSVLRLKPQIPKPRLKPVSVRSPQLLSLQLFSLSRLPPMNLKPFNPSPSAPSLQTPLLLLKLELGVCVGSTEKV